MRGFRWSWRTRRPQRWDFELATRCFLADDAPFGPISSFADKVDKPVKLVIQRGKEKLDKTVTPKSELPMEMFLQATRDSARLIEEGGKKLGYVHLWTQANASFEQVVDGLALNRVCRYRTGSSSIFGTVSVDDPEGFGDVFFRPGSLITWDYGGGNKNPQRFGYGKPLVVLINGGSRSAERRSC